MFIVSKPKTIEQGERQGEIRYPEDKETGVGILLSDRLEKKVTSFGSEGERICWVRIRGPVCHLFVVVIYLPHRGRTTPAQDDTLADLQKVSSHRETVYEVEGCSHVNVTSQHHM